MPRPGPATLPDIGPGPYRRPGDHPGPAEPDSRESGHHHAHHLESEVRRPGPGGSTSLPPIVRAPDHDAPPLDATLVLRASVLVVDRLHTIGLQVPVRDHYVHIAQLFKGIGGMRFVSNFVTFFLDHLVPPSLARQVRPQPTLLPGRPFHIAADSGEGTEDAPLHIFLPAVCVPVHRSPVGWVASVDSRAANEPGTETLAAPTAVRIGHGSVSKTWFARMWENGYLSVPVMPTPFEIHSESPRLEPAMRDKLRSGARVVVWKLLASPDDPLPPCAAPPPRSTTFCVRIRHHEHDTQPEAMTHMHVTFDVPLAELVQSVCDEVRLEAKGRRLEPRAREAWERPVVVRRGSHALEGGSSRS